MAQRPPAIQNSQPSPLITNNVTRDVAKAEFARRLNQQLVLKGWNQTELAKEAARIAPEGVRLGRDKVSNYIRAKNFPSPVHLQILCDALGCKSEDLLPVRGKRKAEISPEDIAISEVGDGTVWLRINEVVPWPVALQVMALLRGSPEKE